MEGQAEAEQAAEASMYSQAPSIEGHLYHNYLESGASSSSSSSHEEDAYARGQAEMQTWIDGMKQDIEHARENHVTDSSFLENAAWAEGETESSADSGATLSAAIQQQMNEQLDQQIRGMTQQQIEQQAQQLDMLDADAADAREMGWDDSSFVETAMDHEQQHHMQIHESLRGSMNSHDGMETLHELAMERAREQAVKRAETWLQDGLDDSDPSALLETDSHTHADTDTDTETDADADTAADTDATTHTDADTDTMQLLGAGASAEQLAAQEARIWASLSTEAKAAAAASMALDTLLQHTAEIHAINEGATTILDHLISNGWLHHGIDSFQQINEQFEINQMEMEQEATVTTLTSCSLSSSNHLRAPTSCSCPTPSILVTCTTDAPPSYHTNMMDITDRIVILRTLIAEIQRVLGRSERIMAKIQEHVETYKDGVIREFEVERDFLTRTLSEASQQLLGYEKQYAQQIDIQSWSCSNHDGTRSFQGRPGIIKASVTQLC